MCLSQNGKNVLHIRLVGGVILAMLPMSKWLLPRRKLLFVCDRFPEGKIVSGKFPWIRQKEEKSSVPMTVTDVSSMG